MSDIFQEVEEDVRREKYEELWKKYGSWIITGAVVFVASVAGYQAWQAYDRSARISDSEAFIAALEKAEKGSEPDAAAAFEELSKTAGSGYSVLASFQRAALLTQSGDIDGAHAVYDELSEDSSIGRDFRELAVIKSSFLKADLLSFEEMTARVGPIVDTKSQWRYSARELLAYAALRANKLDEALAAYESLSTDVDAPVDVRARAVEMLAITEAAKKKSTGIGGTETSDDGASAPQQDSQSDADDANASPESPTN